MDCLDQDQQLIQFIIRQSIKPHLQVPEGESLEILQLRIGQQLQIADGCLERLWCLPDDSEPFQAAGKRCQ